MTAITAHQSLTLLSWFAIAIVLVILLLIARFYESVSGERTYFWLFGAPIILWGIASARYAFLGQVGGDPLGDVLWLAGGLLLACLCIYLYNLMTAGR